MNLEENNGLHETISQSRELIFTKQLKALSKQLILKWLKDILVKVDVRLGSTHQKLGDLLTVDEGSIIQLNKLSGDAVDVFVADKLFARGEVVVVEENFGVRVTELVK